MHPVPTCVRPAFSARLGEVPQGLADGLFNVEWNSGADLAIAERLGAQAIATLDLRGFAPVELAGHPAPWPRDLQTIPASRRSAISESAYPSS